VLNIFNASHIYFAVLQLFFRKIKAWNMVFIYAVVIRKHLINMWDWIVANFL